MKHYLRFAAILLILTSCTRTILIHAPEGSGTSTLFYGEEELTLPTTIEYVENSILTFKKEHHRIKMVDISEISENEYTPTLTPKKYTLNLETYFEGVTFYINESKIDPPVLLPYGEYKVKASLDGYLEKYFTVLLERDTLHQIGRFEKALTVINIPDGITIYNSDEYTMDEGIEGSFAPPYLSLQFSNKRLPINVAPYIEEQILDFSKIPESMYKGRKLGPDNQHPGITVSADWLKPLQQSQDFSIQSGFTVGFHGGEINLPEINENELFSWYSNITILKPTKDILGSTVTIQADNEVKKIQISQEMLDNAETYSDPFEDTEFKYLSIYTISSQPPFTDTEYEVSLISEAAVKQSITTHGRSFLTNDKIAVYPQKRTSAFSNPKEDNDFIYYVYVTPDAKEKYFLVYEHLNTSLGDDGIFSPVYAAPIVSAPGEPAVVKIDPSLFSGDLCFIVQNPAEVSGQDMIFSEKVYLRKY